MVNSTHSNSTQLNSTRLGSHRSTRPNYSTALATLAPSHRPLRAHGRRRVDDDFDMTNDSDDEMAAPLQESEAPVTLEESEPLGTSEIVELS